jgi:hypothetical protein
VDERWQRIRVAWLDNGKPGVAARPDDALLLEQLERDRVLAITDDDPTIASREDATPMAFRLRRAHPYASVPDPARAPALLVVRVFAQPADADEFRRWLDEEHAPRQLTIGGVHWYLGYEEEGGRRSFLNVWGLDDPAVVGGETWARTRDTAWYRRVEHVLADADRGVYRPVSPVA